MAFDAFLKISDIPGESTDDKHKDWIEIVSYNQAVNQPVASSPSGAGGASAERVNFGAFSISKLVDKASPKLFEAACTGKHIKEITLEVCRAGDDKQKYLEIRIEQALVTNYVQDGGSDFPFETISFYPGKFKIVYSQQKRSDGIPGGNIVAGWDLTTNKTFA